MSDLWFQSMFLNRLRSLPPQTVISYVTLYHSAICKEHVWTCCFQMCRDEMSKNLKPYCIKEKYGLIQQSDLWWTFWKKQVRRIYFMPCISHNATQSTTVHSVQVLWSALSFDQRHTHLAAAHTLSPSSVLKYHNASLIDLMWISTWWYQGLVF